MKIKIFGDSFSSDQVSDSWVTFLSEHHEVTNYSQRGISEYRIYKNILYRINDIVSADVVIVFHTNPDRVYVPDHVLTPSRQLHTHPFCDMLATDSSEKWIPSEIYYKNFYDQGFQDTMFDFLINGIRKKLKNVKLLEFSGFDIQTPGIHSISALRERNPGSINHLDIMGNITVFELIQDQLQ